MNRLQSELQRLYLPPAASGAGPGPLIGADGRLRALVLGMAAPASQAAPADWPACARVWQGVQADLGWPAPAIAVAGEGGFQLWFSLAEPVDLADARAALAALRARYLPDAPAARLQLLPAGAGGAVQHAPMVPAPLATPGQWSAFVSQDLAPLFAETPWLDTPPGDDGQAGLLARLASIRPGDWQQGLAALQPAQAAPPTAMATAAPADRPPAPADPAPANPGGAAAGHSSPRRFLLAVMNDESVPMALRIEAAKALLPHEDDLP